MGRLNFRKDACDGDPILDIGAGTMADIDASELNPSPRVILPNLNRRFSGITSTMLQVVEYQKEMIPLVVWGSCFVGKDVRTVGFCELLSLTRMPLPGGELRVYHARRNIEMLWGLILKFVFRRKLKLIFTSTAQRNHSAYTRSLIRQMDAIITTSDRAGSYLESPANYIVPHGINVNAYPFVEDKAEAWKRLKLPGERGIGIFGRIRPQKGVDLFVEAMIEVLPQFPEYMAVIVGKTTPKFERFVQSLKDKITQAGLEDRFVWKGEVAFEELPSLFGAMSIVAAVSRVEGFGLTCLEAMSSGAPVIASRTGGFEMVIRDGIDGRLVECNDTDAIAEAFNSMAEDPLRLAEMARSGRSRVEESFSIEREAKELIDAYNTVARY